MPPITALVAVTSPDVKANVVFFAVENRPDMLLAERRVVSLFEVDGYLRGIAPDTACVLILVGHRREAQRLEDRWLAERKHLIIVHLEVVDDVVRLSLRDPDLDSLLNSLGELSMRDGLTAADRTVYVPAAEPAPVAPPETPSTSAPIWGAVHDWLRVLLGAAARAIAERQGGMLGFTIDADRIEHILAAEGTAPSTPDFQAADEALDAALASTTDAPDRLRTLMQVLDLDALERRLLLLALAPELDVRFQRCVGLLLDDATRRLPTLSLCAALLGEQAQVRAGLAQPGRLSRWSLFEGGSGLPAADAPLRIAQPIVDWLFGANDALARDAEVLRVVRQAPWEGASLFERDEDITHAAAMVRRLRGDVGKLFVFDLASFPDWPALLERGAQSAGTPLLRVDCAALAALDAQTLQTACVRLAWCAKLGTLPLVFDTREVDFNAQADQALATAMRFLHARGCAIGWLSKDLPRCIRLFGTLPHSLAPSRVDSAQARTQNMHAATRKLGIALDPQLERATLDTIPLDASGIERAMHLAEAMPGSTADKADRFLQACRDVAAEEASGLATSIAPAWSLKDAVLAPDTERQLYEIVANVQQAHRVLDEWKFGEKLPYGRGIAALFQGPSGTGKTMCSLGIAHELGTRVLRVDLSRVVSKYIGDTEKHMAQVFEDGRRCGAVIVIDEADAILGKRSEVKDAHDRYANIEVAYLLQRIESYEGLAIFTTNLRHNLDSAFLRRLRFVIDFPRPDAEARAQIWERCLPDGTHTLKAPDFHMLGRKIDLTGGHIRQITLRAAFLAAASDDCIGLSHITEAARAELAKLGLPPVDLQPYARREAA